MCSGQHIKELLKPGKFKRRKILKEKTEWSFCDLLMRAILTYFRVSQVGKEVCHVLKRMHILKKVMLVDDADKAQTPVMK